MKSLKFIFLRLVVFFVLEELDSNNDIHAST